MTLDAFRSLRAGRASLLAAALLAAACDSSTTSPSTPPPAPALAPSRTFNLSGVVYETTADGMRQPVAGAGLTRWLVAPGHTGGDGGWTTDAEGRYAIENLVSGSRVEVQVFSGPWFQPCAAVATMTGDVTLDIEVARRVPPRVTMTASPTLSGTVFTTAANGERRPSAGNQIHYMSQCRGLVLARTYSDADGRFALCRLPPGPGCVTLTLQTGPGEYDFVEKRTDVVVQGDIAVELDANVR